MTEAATAIRQGLPAELREQLTTVCRLRSTASTSDLLLSLAPEHLQGVLVVADAQTAGRGRAGARWVSAAGRGLYFSLGWTYPCAPPRLGPLSLVAGIACAEALQPLLVAPLRLKWPNDLMVGEAKLGGLLVELKPARSGTSVVIGVGINLEVPDGQVVPGELARTGLVAHARAELPDPAGLLALVLTGLLPALAAYRPPEFGPWLPRFAALDGLQGEEICWQSEHGPMHGRVLGLREDGSLEVATREGSTRLRSGSVSQVRPERVGPAAPATARQLQA